MRTAKSNWTKKKQETYVYSLLRGRIHGYYRFLKRFYGLAQIQLILQERIDKTLEFKHQARLDDTIIVTKGNIEEHEMEMKATMKKLEEAGYRLHLKKANSSKEKGGTPKKTKRNQTITRQTRSNHENKYSRRN